MKSALNTFKSPSLVVAILVIWGFHVWVSGGSMEAAAAAIRILPDGVSSPVKKNATAGGFSVSEFHLNGTANFADSKRRIPSCPDPLHN
ncbi:hypothetical protein M569_08799 [Genlisea aurea]|uniref:Uncharacterized protein n=1 Tax=Genlisea aurea TaxID=192259 RepID=S8DS79_9LAMI|nr:hypothetical protein M569_08799 [Genlisea aurea]